jgi:hypothetical protein
MKDTKDSMSKVGTRDSAQNLSRSKFQILWQSTEGNFLFFPV